MVSVLALLFVVAWHEWQSNIITVYFPDGSTKILGEQSITNSQWHVYASPPSPPVSVSRSLKVFWFKASEVLHHTHYSLPQPIPNPARLVDFAGNIRPCAEMSHKTILVADELYSISGTNWMDGSAAICGKNKNGEKKNREKNCRSKVKISEALLIRFLHFLNFKYNG